MRSYLVIFILTVFLSFSMVAYVPSKFANTSSKIPIENQEQSVSTQPELYYGVWVVKDIAAWARVSAMSEQEAKGFIGKKLYLSEGESRFEDRICKKPFYKKTLVSSDDFFNDGYTRLDQIGINKKSVEQVEVFSKMVSILNLLGINNEKMTVANHIA